LAASSPGKTAGRTRDFGAAHYRFSPGKCLALTRATRLFEISEGIGKVVSYVTGVPVGATEVATALVFLAVEWLAVCAGKRRDFRRSRRGYFLFRCGLTVIRVHLHERRAERSLRVMQPARRDPKQVFQISAKGAAGMSMKIKPFLFALLLTVSCTSYAGTTRMDNENWAFRPRAVFAVNNGEWKAPGYQLILGLKGNFFIVDARNASKSIPAECRRQLRVDIKKNVPEDNYVPKSLWKNGFGHRQFIQLNDHESGCSANVWLKAPVWYPDGEFGQIKPPSTSSIIIGLIEFTVESESTLVEFAVGADDV
jgi:hypothetical protein